MQFTKTTVDYYGLGGKKGGVYSSRVSLQMHIHPEPQNSTLFGKRVSADVIKMQDKMRSLWMKSKPWCPYKDGTGYQGHGRTPGRTPCEDRQRLSHTATAKQGKHSRQAPVAGRVA